MSKTPVSNDPQQKESTNLFDDAFIQNPYPTFSTLRKEEPVYKALMPDGSEAWIVTRYEDAVNVLKDQRFIKDFIKAFDVETDTDSHEHIMEQNMLFSDPPDHRRLRSLVQQAFTPRLIKGLRGRIERVTNDLLDAVQDKRAMDLINDFAFPLPIIIICEMLGVPSEDRDSFRKWSNTIVENSNDMQEQNQVDAHTKELADYLKALIAKRRRQPKDDLVTHLIQAEEEGENLSESELYGVIALLIVAGHETTVNLIANGILSLLNHPEQKVKLMDHPELIKTAVEECLRFEAPVEFTTGRWAAEDMVFEGETISKGDYIMVALSSANHDPEKFANPEQFDIDRQSNRHLSFGMGIHYCLGAQLARLEAEIAISTLLHRLPNLRLNIKYDELQWRSGLLMRGVRDLPVVF